MTAAASTLDMAALRARSTDPSTSHAAALKAAQFAESHAGRVLGALQRHGPQTAHELATITGLSVVQIDRRLPDLKRTGRAHVAEDQHGHQVVRGGARVWEAL